MGVVYLAEDPRLNRQVAIKTVELALDDPEQRDFLRTRLLRDAQAAAALSHPNIVSVYDVVEEPTSAYVVMEYVDGESLAARLRRVGRPDPSFVLRVLREMAAALDYTHARGVIHRDIKPGNVMIDAAGRAKIMDFGIARIADSRTNTPTGMVMGTIHYMAPEQIKGEALDGRCDQFALGAVAYEMLTGTTMFGAQTLATLAYKIVNEDPPLMRSVNSELPESMDAVIRKALAKQPWQRFLNCSEFVKALEAAFAGHPVALDAPVRDAPTQTMSIPASALQPVQAPVPATAAQPAPVVVAAAPARRPWMAVTAAGGVLVVAAGALAMWKPWAAPHSPVAASVAANSATVSPPTPQTPPEKAPEVLPKPPAESAVAHTNQPKPSVAERTAEVAAKAPKKDPPQPPEPKIAAVEDSEPETGEDEKGKGPAAEAFQQGNQLAQSGDYAGAMAAYTKALSLKPQFVAAHVNRGLAHARQNDFNGAVADYTQAIDMRPKYAQPYLLRGNARVELKQPDLAMSDFSRAIELKPDLAAAWGARGALYLHQQKYQKALSDLNEAIQRAPHREKWYEFRAAARRATGDEAGARADLQQASRMEGRKVNGIAGKQF
jgi:Tfp pilus assembly protein PilF